MADKNTKVSLQVLPTWQVQNVASKVLNQFEEKLSDAYIWINEAVAEAKKTFKTSDIKLLPKTPSASRQAKRRCPAGADVSTISLQSLSILTNCGQQVESNLSTEAASHITPRIGNNLDSELETHHDQVDTIDDPSGAEAPESNDEKRTSDRQSTGQLQAVVRLEKIECVVSDRKEIERVDDDKSSESCVPFVMPTVCEVAILDYPSMIREVHTEQQRSKTTPVDDTDSDEEIGDTPPPPQHRITRSKMVPNKNADNNLVDIKNVAPPAVTLTLTSAGGYAGRSTRSKMKIVNASSKDNESATAANFLIPTKPCTSGRGAGTIIGSKVQQLQEILCQDSGFGLRPSPKCTTQRTQPVKRTVENVSVVGTPKRLCKDSNRISPDFDAKDALTLNTVATLTKLKGSGVKSTSSDKVGTQAKRVITTTASCPSIVSNHKVTLKVLTKDDLLESKRRELAAKDKKILELNQMRTEQKQKRIEELKRLREEHQLSVQSRRMEYEQALKGKISKQVEQYSRVGVNRQDNKRQKDDDELLRKLLEEQQQLELELSVAATKMNDRYNHSNDNVENREGDINDQPAGNKLDAGTLESVENVHVGNESEESERVAFVVDQAEKRNQQVLKDNEEGVGKEKLNHAEISEKQKSEKDKLLQEELLRMETESEKTDEEIAQIQQETVAKENERKRLEQEKLDTEKLEKEKQEKLESEKLEKQKQEKLEREKLEKEKQEKLEREKLEKEKQEKLEWEKLEKEKQEKLEREKLEKEKQEKLEREKLEKEKQDREKLKKERREREEQRRLKMEMDEQERVKRLKEQLELQEQERQRLKDERERKERMQKEKKDNEKRLERERQERIKLEKILQAERLTEEMRLEERIRLETEQRIKDEQKLTQKLIDKHNQSLKHKRSNSVTVPNSITKMISVSLQDIRAQNKPAPAAFKVGKKVKANTVVALPTSNSINDVAAVTDPFKASNSFLAAASVTRPGNLVTGTTLSKTVDSGLLPNASQALKSVAEATLPSKAAGTVVASATTTMSNTAAAAAKPTLQSGTNALNKTFDKESYEMTPKIRKDFAESTAENYNINDLNSEDSTDEEDKPRKKMPLWAQGTRLKVALIQQCADTPDLQKLFGKVLTPNLNLFFDMKKKRFNKRTSSAVWDEFPSFSMG